MNIPQYALTAAGILLLGAVIFILYRLEKQTKGGGVDWKAYPGFVFPPNRKKIQAYFYEGDSGGAKRSCLRYLMGAVLLIALMMGLVSFNTALTVRVVRCAMLILPVPLLLVQEAELLLAAAWLKKGGGEKDFFYYIVVVKLVLLALWVLLLFASLLVRGAQL